MDIHELARQNQQSAWKVLEDTCIIEAWERIGATVHLVGSLRTGLLAKSRDIDIHIYTDRLDVGESFSVIRELAERLPLQEIQYRNLIHTEEECMEWHALYKDREQNMAFSFQSFFGLFPFLSPGPVRSFQPFSPALLSVSSGCPFPGTSEWLLLAHWQ